MNTSNCRLAAGYKHWIASVFVFFGCISIPWLQASSVAQTSSNSESQLQWDKIQKADARIWACRVTWKRSFSLAPNPSLGAAKRVERAVEQARQQDANEGTLQRSAKQERQIVQRETAGITATTLLKFVRIGTIIRCDVEHLEAKSRGIDFYDGKNSIFVETQINGTKVPFDGVLQRDERDILSHSEPTWQTARFLLGMPISQAYSAFNPPFTPATASLSEGPDKTLVLEKRTEPIAGQPGIEYSAHLRLTLSNEHLRPIAYQVSNMLYKQKGGRIMGEVSVTDYRRYANGVWFPSKVTVRAGKWKTEYTLLEAAFNEDVDPMEVRLPAGIRVADSRFGLGDKLATYKLKDGKIPTDEEVKKMLEVQHPKTRDANAAATEATNAKTEQLSTFPLAPALGLLLMAVGGVLWTRSSTKGNE